MNFPWQHALKTNTFVAIWRGVLVASIPVVILRLTWELPQTILGLLLASIWACFCRLEVRTSHAVLIIRRRTGRSWGMALGGILLGGPELQPGNVLFTHEYGHTIQSRMLGPLYLLVIGLPSLISAFTDPARHLYRSFERDATLRGWLALGRSGGYWPDPRHAGYPFPAYSMGQRHSPWFFPPLFTKYIRKS